MAINVTSKTALDNIDWLSLILTAGFVCDCAFFLFAQRKSARESVGKFATRLKAAKHAS